jgi:hypothetical protein
MGRVLMQREMIFFRIVTYRRRTCGVDTGHRGPPSPREKKLGCAIRARRDKHKTSLFLLSFGPRRRTARWRYCTHQSKMREGKGCASVRADGDAWGCHVGFWSTGFGPTCVRAAWDGLLAVARRSLSTSLHLLRRLRRLVCLYSPRMYSK